MGAAFKGTFSQTLGLGALQQQAGSFVEPSQYRPPGNTPQFYQVQEEDRNKNIVDIANQYGLAPDNVIKLNKSKTLPPTGSYIQLIQQGVPPEVAAQISAGTGAKLPGEGRGDPAAQTLRKQANEITQLLLNEQMPDTVPLGALGFIRDPQGIPLTLQDFLNEGYVMDKKGNLVRPGSPGAGGSWEAQHAPSAEFMQTQAYQFYQNTPFMEQKRVYKGKLVKIKDLVRRGVLDLKTGRTYDQPMKRNRKGKLVRANQSTPAPAPAPVAVTPSREAPTTVLDIHLGSG